MTRAVGKIVDDKEDLEEVEALYGPVAREAVKRFPVDAKDVKLVTHSENITFRVRTPGDQTDYVLRLHRPGYSSIEEMESERVWTHALKETGVLVQDALQTFDGQNYTLVDIPGTGEQRYVGMTTWHEGIPLTDFLETCTDGAERERIFRRFGAIAAAFHNQSTEWSPPPGFVRRRLDLDALLGESPFWGRFWEHEALSEAERDLMLQARARARDALDEYGESPDKFSLIHADFTPDNIIYDGKDLAIIDFDDAAYGWHLYDIASALIECRYDRDLDVLRAALLDGYREHRPLTANDIEMLPVFVLVRGMATVGWLHQRPESVWSSYCERIREWVLEECAAYVA